MHDAFGVHVLQAEDEASHNLLHLIGRKNMFTLDLAEELSSL